MYQVPWPATACNAATLQGFIEYRMWNTIGEAIAPGMLAANILSVAKTAPRGRLAALVLNAHGYLGHLEQGTGIEASDAPSFACLKGFVDQIYIVGCAIAGVRLIELTLVILTGWHSAKRYLWRRTPMS